MRCCALVACIAAVGCAPRATPSPIAVAADSCAGGGVTLWLDFDGAGVVYASADDSAAMPVQSTLAPASAVIPPFSEADSAPRMTRAQAMAAVTDRVRTLFRPFAVGVVTTRPAAAPYTRVLVGGTAGVLGVSSTEAGLAPLDCGNVSDADVAYDFAAAQTPDFGGVVGIANTAAHEAGHAFGLEHVDDPHDVMYAAAQPTLTLPDLFALRFGKSGAFSAYGSSGRSCTSSDPVDEPAILDCAVGAALTGGDETPPTVDWTTPSELVPPTLSLSASASDDVGVVRVEAYKNLELVASLTAPPYAFTVDAAPGEHFYLTVEAIDAAGNRGTLTRALSATTPLATDGGVAPPDLATPPSPMVTAPPATGGCALAPSSPPPPWPWLFLAVALAVRAWCRSSGSGSSAPRRR